MSIINNKKALDSALPIEGELSKGPRGSLGWVSILKVLIAVLTALAGSLGIVSCMS